MVKLINPKPYYLIDFKDVGRGAYTEEIYAWACRNHDTYMLDGDGDIPIYGILKLVEKHEWASIAWDKLTLFQQNEVLRRDAGLRIRVYQ